MRPKRQKVWLAFLGSVLLHGIALVIFALVVALRPPPPPPETPPDEPMQLEVAQEEPPETPPPLPDVVPTPTPTPASKLVVDAAGPDAESPPPADSSLSDRNTRASSSEDGATNPGTTQAGHKMASFQFDPRPPAPGVTAPAEPPAPTAAPETAPELPKPDRSARRRPPSPTPSAATPPPEATPAATVNPDEFAVAMATPPPLPEDPFDPSIRSTSPPLPKPAARPARPTDKRTPTPAAGAMRSAENGASANRGPGGVDTVATPSGRYTRKVADMIKFVWSRSIESRDDLRYGATVIHLSIDREGLVIGPRVASNTADTMFASTALQAVVVARLPAMPDDVVQELDGKRLPMDITFERTPMPQEAALH